MQSIFLLFLTAILANATFAQPSASFNLAGDFQTVSDTCQPSTFLKMYGEQGKLENMTAMCAAPDGNLYLAGRKGPGFAIAKMSPEGTFIWVRVASTAPDECEISEIIVDSEGMIAGIGKKISPAAAVQSFAFRYNPASNQILWAQEFSSK